MRVFQRLFTNQISSKTQFRVIRMNIKELRPPPSFFLIPYEEQYEPRDFLKNKVIKKGGKKKKIKE